MGQVSGAARSWHRRRRDQRLGYSALGLGAGGFVLVLAGTLLVTEVVPNLLDQDPPPAQRVVPSSQLAPTPAPRQPSPAQPVVVVEGAVVQPVRGPRDPGADGPAQAPDPGADPDPQGPGPSGPGGPGGPGGPSGPGDQPEGPVGSVVDPLVQTVADTAGSASGGATTPLTTPVTEVVDGATDVVDGLVGGVVGGLLP